jgi:CHAT domain-containing protein
MSRLYQRVAAGSAPVDALRATLRDLRATHPHPYYWSPFELTVKSAQA